MKFLVLFSLSVVSVFAQRGSYAGVRPIENGIKGPFPTPLPTGINNRFGENGIDNTPTQPLPIDALGDAYLVNKLNQLPPEQRPFWLLNYQIIEAHRNQPQLGAQPFANRGSFLGRR